jgi:quercetin dioxygenase-like cupin family protein
MAGAHVPKPDSPEFGTTFDLAEIAAEMLGEAEYTVGPGHAARTILRAHDLRVVLIAIRAGAHVAEHVAQGTAAIQVVSGRVRIRLPRLARQHEDRFEELSPGRLLALGAGLAHSVEALEDSALLVTLGWPRERPDVP